MAPLRDKRRDRGEADRRKAKPYIIGRDLAFEPPGGGFHGINIEGFSPLAAQRLAHRMKAMKTPIPFVLIE